MKDLDKKLCVNASYFQTVSENSLYFLISFDSWTNKKIKLNTLCNIYRKAQKWKSAHIKMYIVFKLISKNRIYYRFEV